MEKKTFSYIYFGYIVLLAIYTYFNSEFVVNTIVNDGMLGIIYYFVTNPAYVLILVTIFMLNRDTSFIRTTIASFLIIFSADILSYPRMGAVMSSDINLLASIDGIMFNHLLASGMSYNVIYTIYYLILPILLLVLALWFLGVNDFYKRLIGK